MKTQEKKHFVIPFFAGEFLNLPILISGHLYWIEGDTICKIHQDENTVNYELLSILKRQYLNEDGYEEIPLPVAIKFIEGKAGIWVKESFDTSSIDDLKEIKEQLPEGWIKLVNEFVPNIL